MKLRPIQEAAIQETLDSFKTGELYHLLQAAVAFGKTIYSSELIRRSHAKYGAKTLFLAHLKELVLQTAEKLEQVAPEVNYGIMMAQRKEVEDVTIGTRQTVSQNLELFGPINLIIIDEVHVFSADNLKIVEYFLKLNPRLRVLGLTGTPFGSKGYIYGEDKLWDEPFFTATVDQMIGMGYLSPYRYKVVEQPKLDNVKIVGGDFNEGDLGEEMIQHMGSIQKAIDEHAADRNHIMVFCVTIDHGEQVAELLGAKCVHSKLDKKVWRERVDEFKEGRVRFIVNISQLAVGFDAPVVDCIVMARPTMNPALATQICGRSIRICEGKKDALILDLVNNYSRVGLPSNPKVRTPEEREEKETKELTACVCPECLQITENGTVCQFCGAELTEKIEIIAENERLRLEEIETKAKQLHIERLWVKQNHVTKKGNRGDLFGIKLDKKTKPVFHFAAHSSKNLMKKHERFGALKIGQPAMLTNSAQGPWVNW